MLRKIRKFWADYQAERRRTRWLNEKLEGLIDPTFIDRAYAGEQADEA